MEDICPCIPACYIEMNGVNGDKELAVEVEEEMEALLDSDCDEIPDEIPGPDGMIEFDYCPCMEPEVFEEPPFGIDHDGDGVPDYTIGEQGLEQLDNCPCDENQDQLDSDCDGLGDVCDPCPYLGDPEAEESECEVSEEMCLEMGLIPICHVEGLLLAQETQVNGNGPVEPGTISMCVPEECVCCPDEEPGPKTAETSFAVSDEPVIVKPLEFCTAHELHPFDYLGYCQEQLPGPPILLSEYCAEPEATEDPTWPDWIAQGCKGFGVRFKAFDDDPAQGEIYLGVGDLGVGANRVEKHYPWVSDGDGELYPIALAYDASGDKITVAIDGTEQLSFTDVSTKLAALLSDCDCTMDKINVMMIMVADQIESTQVILDDAYINMEYLLDEDIGDFLAPYDMKDRRWWTVRNIKFDPLEDYLVTGTLGLQGTFTSGSNEKAKVEILLGCESEIAGP
jgi:hypothetical protein